MLLSKVELKMAAYSLVEVTHVDPATTTGLSHHALTLQNRLASLLEGDEVPAQLEVPLDRSDLELVVAALASCIECFGHWDSWDFPVRMGGWPSEAKEFLARLKNASLESTLA